MLTYDRLLQAAVLPVLGMLGIGVLLGLASLIGGQIGTAWQQFIGGPSVLIGNLTGGAVTGFGPGFGGGGRVGIVPLAPLMVIALVLARTDVGARARNLKVALIAGVMTGVVWLVAGIIVSIAGSGIDSSPRPFSALLSGVSLWLLVSALVRREGARYFTVAALAWSLLLGVGFAGIVAYTISQFGGTGGDVATVAIATFVGYSVMSANVGVLLGVWPFGLSLTAPDTAGLVPVGTGGVGGDAQFYAIAAEVPWLWLAPLIILALAGWCGWRSAPPTSREQLRRRALGIVGGLWAGLGLAAVVGSVRLTGFGGDAVSAGVAGAPFTLVLPAIIMSLAWLGALYLRANQAGLSWASLPDLDRDDAATANDAWDRIRAGLRNILDGPAAGGQPSAGSPPVGTQPPAATQPAADGPPPASGHPPAGAAPGPAVPPEAAAPPPAQPPAQPQAQPPDPAAAGTPAGPRFCTSCGAAAPGRFCGTCGAPQG